MNTMPRLLRRQTVLELLDISETTLYRKVKKGELPKPISIGGKSMRWREDDLIEWIQSRT